MRRTLRGCQALDFACAEEDLWHQSELALVDCQTTLGELNTLAGKLKDGVRAKGFAWRTRAALDLNIHDTDIATLKDKIHKSNSALQTMLQTINV